MLTSSSLVTLTIASAVRRLASSWISGSRASPFRTTVRIAQTESALYVAIEAVAGGRVEIKRYDADTDPAEGVLVASLEDKLCRFLTTGDVDGDIWTVTGVSEPRRPAPGFLLAGGGYTTGEVLRVDGGRALV